MVSFWLYPVAKRFVSSAKKIGMKYSDACGKSFIYNKNSKSPRMDPGEPHIWFFKGLIHNHSNSLIVGDRANNWRTN